MPSVDKCEADIHSIRRTYHATLAELTSLEEFMRTMMADGGVHNDVVNKLWQVYGTPVV